MILPTQNTSNSHTIFALTNVTIWVQKENFLKIFGRGPYILYYNHNMIDQEEHTRN